MENENPSASDGRPAPAARKRGFGHAVASYLLHVTKVLLFAGLSIALIVYLFLTRVVAPATPDVDDLQQAKSWRPTVVLDADGGELTSFRRGHQQWVGLDGISPYVIQALIATEDRRFYDHEGFDPGRTVAALFNTARGDTQGGSTITQQLARNLFPEEIGRSRNAMRKLKEIMTAVKIERAYSKDQILETYLNTVPFLYNAYGIEMAARTYFGKPAKELDVTEAATLVGMLKGTHYYNPVVNPERARARRNVVLAQMARSGLLSENQYQTLRDTPLQLRFARLPDQTGPSSHFIEYVRKWLLQWADDNDFDLYADGLIVHTTLDPALQETAMESVERQSEVLQSIADVEWSRRAESLLSNSPSAYVRAHKHAEPFNYFWKSRPELLDAFIRESARFRKEVAAGASEAAALASLKKDARFLQELREAKTRLETGFVAIDPASGEVKAWVGSRDFQRDQFDHVAQAQRQPGSTFKPLVYGAALEQGLRPERSYPDRAVEIRFADGEVWRPTDMSGATGQMMTLRDGLILSKNSITAQVMQDVGLPDIISLAQAAGVTQSRLDPVPSLALGTSPVTLLEMVSSYATIAAGGEYRKPIVVRRITDRDGKVVADFGGQARRAMSENTAVELIDMMRGVVSRGTGQAIKAQFNITADIAGKTGTTQYNTDGWFILMHPGLVAGSWVGFNDSRVTMRSNHWGQGGHNAVLVVGDFFRAALKEKLVDPKAKFPKPKRRAPAPVQVKNPVWTPEFSTRIGGDSGMVVRREANGTTFIGDQRAAREAPVEQRAARTADELERILKSMGRDPVTGARGSLANTP